MYQWVINLNWKTGEYVHQKARAKHAWHLMFRPPTKRI